MQFVIDHSYLIPLLPLLAAIVTGFLADRFFASKAHWPIWIGVGISAVMSLILLLGMIVHSRHVGEMPVGQTHDVYTWVAAGNLLVKAGFYIDPLTAIMLSVVTGIGLLITIFSAGYMHGESGYSRFFAYLGLFIFSMTCLVMGSNLLMLYLGWEGVGLCSYLLIGYYYQRPAAAAAAKKAFLVNRVGDFGFAVGIMLCFYAFGTVTYFDQAGHGLLQMASTAFSIGTAPGGGGGTNGLQMTALQYIPFLLMLGAFGKSAQFPLYVWLPDAMEGPTPVSALIHAATMVTAGVYMMVRCGPLFVTSQAALWTIAAVGAFTALFAATIALRQFDLKKVFAYSTISQLGYMFVAVGVLAPTAAVFHLVTHAFFKALLFLSAGVVMHAMLGHLDLRKMSGLKRVLPKTNIVILIGCLALAGFPLTSGFFSKDLIIEQALNHNTLLYAVLLFTAFLTSYYTFRLYFQVFQGPLLQPTMPADEEPATARTVSQAESAASHEAVTHAPLHTSGVDKGAAHDHPHHDPEPWIMFGPLMLLAIGALFVGWLIAPGHKIADFLGHSESLKLSYKMAVARFSATGMNPEVFGQGSPQTASQELIPTSQVIGGVVSIAGILLAALMHLYSRASADRLAAGLGPLTRLLEGKYWIDEVYERLIVAPLRVLAKWFFEIDRVVIDGLVGVVGAVPQFSGFAVKITTQRGYLQGYATAMLFGVLAILLLIYF